MMNDDQKERSPGAKRAVSFRIHHSAFIILVVAVAAPT